MIGDILIYGASGYTGKLIARVASEQGIKPILAGRNLAKVRAVAEPLALACGKSFFKNSAARADASLQISLRDSFHSDAMSACGLPEYFPVDSRGISEHCKSR
jgi:hypothetical protein